jgi:nitroreductase
MEFVEQIQEQDKKVSALDAIYHRRAVRAYSDRKIDEQTVRALIDAAIRAPSAVNAQPWAFVVVQDAQMLRRISCQAARRLASDPHWSLNTVFGSVFAVSGFDIFYGATTLIVICAKREGIHGFDAAQDCYLAGENLMLAAYAMGLGTCPIGFARNLLQTDAWSTELGIPKDYLAVLPIIVGFPKGAVPKHERAPAKIFSWKR